MIEVTGRAVPGSDEILAPDALAFVRKTDLSPSEIAFDAAMQND